MGMGALMGAEPLSAEVMVARLQTDLEQKQIEDIERRINRDSTELLRGSKNGSHVATPRFKPPERADRPLHPIGPVPLPGAEWRLPSAQPVFKLPEYGWSGSAYGYYDAATDTFHAYDTQTEMAFLRSLRCYAKYKGAVINYSLQGNRPERVCLVFLNDHN
jgi:hypothetical protein